MFRIGVVVFGVSLMATVAQALPQRVALYPALDVEAYRAVRGVLSDEGAWRALPSCQGGELPCRLVVRQQPKAVRVGQLADGTCDVSVLFPASYPVAGRFRIQKAWQGCRVVVGRVRTLAMPPDVFNPKPQATITFPDLGDALGGLDVEALLARGFQSQRYRWVSARTKKLAGNSVTRNTRGAVFTEKWASTWPEPRVFLDNFIDQETQGAGSAQFTVWQRYVYHNAPNIPEGLYTNQYPIRNDGLSAWKRVSDGAKNHFSEAIAVMGIRKGYSFGCAFGGELPTGTTGTCITRAATVSTTPIF